jgi:hypothetical protein
MSLLVLRVAILALVGLMTWGIVWTGRRFVEKRRRLALAALPLDKASFGATEAGWNTVRILAFSSEDCRQCHTMQTPALQRVLEARGSRVSVEEIDAPGSPALTERYQVLTVPTTVVLDAGGRAQAVNYGFASTQRLLEQVDAVLGAAVS